MKTTTICNHCVGTIVLSLGDHVVVKGLTFCSADCADAYFSPDNPEPEPIGLLHDLGGEG